MFHSRLPSRLAFSPRAGAALFTSALALSGCIEKTLLGGDEPSLPFLIPPGDGGGGTGGSGTGAAAGTSSGGTGGTTSGTGATGTGATGGTTGSGGGPMNDGWARQFGDSGVQEGRSVAVDASGNILVTGIMAGAFSMDAVQLTTTLTMPPPPEVGEPIGEDILVAKLDPAGNVLWAKNFGNGFYQHGESVAVDAAGNVFVVGGIIGTVDFGGGPFTVQGASHDLFVVKLDPQGNHLWSKQYGDAGLQPGYFTSEVETDATGAVYVAGEFGGTLDFGGGPLTSANTYDGDVFIAKLDANGNHVYSRRFGDAEALGEIGESLGDLTVDAAGNAVISGDMAGTIDFGGGPFTSGGGAFVAKFDPQGNHVWSHVFGNYGAAVTAHCETAQGDVVLAGYFNDLIDFGGGQIADFQGEEFIVKLDSAGQHVWTQQYTGDFFVLDAVADGGGEVTLVGNTTGMLDLAGIGGGVLVSFQDWPNAAIVRVGAADGLLVSAKNYSAPSAVNAPLRALTGVAHDPQGYIVTVGFFEGEIDMGFGLLAAGEKMELLVARLPQSL